MVVAARIIAECVQEHSISDRYKIARQAGCLFPVRCLVLAKVVETGKLPQNAVPAALTAVPGAAKYINYLIKEFMESIHLAQTKHQNNIVKLLRDSCLQRCCRRRLLRLIVAQACMLSFWCGTHDLCSTPP